VEAHLAKSALAFNGIEAWLENEYLNATQWSWSGCSILLKVAAEDAERAARLIDEGNPRLELRLQRGRPIECPDCGGTSTEVIRRPPDRYLSWLVYALRYGASNARCRCKACGYEWKAPW
jgi:hypothetical protein